MSLKMLLLCVFSLQFVMIRGDLICVVMGLQVCYNPFLVRSDEDYCSGADATIECLKNRATDCGLKDTKEIVIIEDRLKEACQAGTDLNKAFEEHKTCVFRRAPASAVSCYTNMKVAMQKYTITGNTKKDEEALFKIACKFADETRGCLSEKVKETCGEDAARFQYNFSSSDEALMSRICNGAEAFQLTWRVLLLASIAMFAIKDFNLNL